MRRVTRGMTVDVGLCVAILLQQSSGWRALLPSMAVAQAGAQSVAETAVLDYAGPARAHAPRGAHASAHEQHAPTVAGSADVTQTVYLPLSVRGGSSGEPSPTPIPSATPSPTPNGGLPPAGAVLSRAYKDVIDMHYASYPPKAGECSKEIHARFWAYGPDGKVYPTWHPPIDPVTGCRFGHEHGRNPAGSNLAAESLAFGYVNEQLSPNDTRFSAMKITWAIRSSGSTMRPSLPGTV